MKQERAGKAARRVLTGLVLLGCLAAESALAETARDLTAGCAFYASGKPRHGYELLYDGTYGSAWESNRAQNVYLETRLPRGETCTGVQIKWAETPDTWCVEILRDGEWVSCYEKKDEYQTDYVPLPCVTMFRIAAHRRTSGKLFIHELNVLGPGETPAWVQRWEPTFEEADLLLLVAHPDDEFIFMGGVIPYYGAGQGKKVLVAYLTQSSAERRTELLDGLWTVGQRSYPLLGRYRDAFSLSLDEAYKQLGKARTQRYMIGLIRRYKPQVVVTHDTHGEYGHGAHKLCAGIVLNAVKNAADPNVEPRLAAQYGTWDVPKTYLHLYPECQLVMDWHTPLVAFGGRSAYDMAKLGYLCHQSQQHTKYRVYDDGPYDSKRFGLARSLVGPDTERDDFFEHLGDPWLVCEDAED